MGNFIVNPVFPCAVSDDALGFATILEVWFEDYDNYRID